MTPLVPGIDQAGCENRRVWAVSRRTGLFIVSYVPLAAMFVVLKWPQGWDAGQLIRLGMADSRRSGAADVLPVLVTVTGRRVQVGVLIVLAGALVVVIIAALNGWFEPFALQPSDHHTSAATSALGFGFVSLGLMLVALLLYNAHRAGGVYWTVTDTSEQGAAVAGYLATYLLPLLAVGVGGWRVHRRLRHLPAGALGRVRPLRSAVLINPTLYLFRFRIYDAQVRVDADPPRMRHVLMLTRLRITDGARVRIKPSGGDNHLALPPR